MGRWNFDGFEKLEACIEVNVVKFRAIILPRLKRVENTVNIGEQQHKESFKAVINRAIDRLVAVEAWRGDFTREGEILDELEEDIAPFEASPPEVQRTSGSGEPKDEAAVKLLRDGDSSNLVRDIESNLASRECAPEATLTFFIRELGKNQGWEEIPNYPARCTLADLADRLAGLKYQGFPEFWLQKQDNQVNRVTESGIYWEWQKPSTRVAEVTISGLETVTMEGDYVVVVLLKDGMESGMPIGLLSGPPRRSAIDCLKEVFQGHKVERVQWLETTTDASEEKFDRLTFYIKMTALFVEVLTVADNAAKYVQGELPTTSKGKGRQQKWPQ